MITCIVNSDPRTRLVVRGCVIVIVAVAALLSGCFVLAAIPAVNAAPAPQATAVVCTRIGTVRLAANVVGVNVRAEPRYAAPITANALKPGVDYPVEAQSGNFVKLCGAGWSARLSESGQTLLLFTVAPPTATPTATPTRLSPATTPQVGSVWICHAGVCHECRMPCIVEIRSEP